MRAKEKDAELQIQRRTAKVHDAREQLVEGACLYFKIPNVPGGNCFYPW